MGKYSKEDCRAAAESILQQLGGTGTLVAMIGAKHFIFGETKNGEPYLSFQWPSRGAENPNAVQITLNALDTYDIEFTRLKTKPPYRNTLAEAKGVFVEQLIETFELNTGLYLSLGSAPRF